MKLPKLPKLPTVKIDWAFVDVKRGRNALATIIGPRNAPVRYRVPITLTGHLTEIGSRDDGTSIEFEMTVAEAKLGAPTPV